MDECDSFKEIEELNDDSIRSSALIKHVSNDRRQSPDLQTFFHLLDLIQSTNEEELIHSLSQIYRFVRHKNYRIFIETNASDAFVEAINLFISNRANDQNKNIYELPSLIFKILYKMAEDEVFDDFFTPALLECVIDAYHYLYDFEFFNHCIYILFIFINFIGRKILFEPIIEYLSTGFIEYLLEQIHDLFPIQDNMIQNNETQIIKVQQIHIDNEKLTEGIYDYKNDKQGELRNTIVLLLNKILCLSFKDHMINYNPIELLHKLIDIIQTCLSYKQTSTNFTASIFFSSLIIKETPIEVLNEINDHFHENIIELLQNEDFIKCRDNIFECLILLAQYHENVMKEYIHVLNMEINIQPISSFCFLIAVLCNCNDITILQSIPNSLWINMLLDSSESLSFNDKELVVKSLTGLITTKQELLVTPFITENCYIIWFIINSLDSLSFQNIKNSLISLIIIRNYMEKINSPYIDVYSDSELITKLHEIQDEYEESDDIFQLINELIPENSNDSLQPT